MNEIDMGLVEAGRAFGPTLLIAILLVLILFFLVRATLPLLQAALTLVRQLTEQNKELKVTLDNTAEALRASTDDRRNQSAVIGSNTAAMKETKEALVDMTTDLDRVADSVQKIGDRIALQIDNTAQSQKKLFVEEIGKVAEELVRIRSDAQQQHTHGMVIAEIVKNDTAATLLRIDALGTNLLRLVESVDLLVQAKPVATVKADTVIINPSPKTATIEVSGTLIDPPQDGAA